MTKIGEYIAVSSKIEIGDFEEPLVTSAVLGQFVTVCCCAFLAIVFIQSAYDKLSGYKGNLDWLKGHFAASPFKNQVPVLLAVLTVLESLSGLACAAGALFCWTASGRTIGLAGLMLAVITFLCLLLGQRLAKEYAGAASLTGYFLVAMLGIISAAFGGALVFVAHYF